MKRPYFHVTLFNHFIDIGWGVFNVSRWSTDAFIILHIEVGKNWDG